MKKLLFVLTILLASYNTYAENKPITYTEVVTVEGTKDELYSRAEAWFATTFVDANEVLQVEDKENGQLIGRGSMLFNPTGLRAQVTVGDISYVVKIFVRVGRYKYEITNFVHKSNAITNPYSLGLITAGECTIDMGGKTANKWVAKRWEEIKETIHPTAERIITKLKQSMSIPAEVENDDW